MAPRAGRTRRIPVYAIVLIVAAVGLAAYWNGLKAPFIWDDDPAIVSNPTIRSVLPLSESLSPPLETPAAGRPLVNLSLAINYAAGNLDETGYHAWNLAVLIASALLLFGIVRLTLAGVDRRLPGDALALAASLIWVVHPLLSETVEYATQRTESMMGFFFLLTLYAAIRGRESGGLARRVGRVVRGGHGDEGIDGRRAAGGPAVRPRLRLRLVARRRARARVVLRRPRRDVGGAGPPDVALAPFDGWRGERVAWTYLVNQAAMIARYLGLAVWPRALVIDYGLPRAIGVADVLPQALLVLALLAGTVVALVRWPAIGFLGAMFFLTLAPTSSVVPIASEVGAERRMYLPLAALSVLAVTLAWALVERLRAKWPARARALTIAAVCVAAAGGRGRWR